MTKSTLHIRPADPKDAEVVCKIRDDAWLATYPNKALGISIDDVRINAQGLHGEFVPRRIAWLTEKFASQNESWSAFVAEVNGAVRGFVMFSRYERDRKFINSLYVDPALHKQGIGTALMQQVLEVMGDEEAIFLEVASYNDNAIHFYEKFGFDKTDATVPVEADRPAYIKPIPQIEMVRRGI